MSDHKWIDLPSRGATSKGRLDPLPPGPYLTCCQFDYNEFEGMDLKIARAFHADKLSMEINWMVGKVYLAFDVNNRATRVAYYYDTSD